MDIREFTTYSEKSPVTGFGVWIVLEEMGHQAHLLHPISLCELVVSEYEFVTCSGHTLWPINSTGSSFHADQFIDRFKKRIAYFLENERSFPVQTIAKALAEFEEISIKEALQFIGTLSVNEFGENFSPVADKTNREYVLRDGINPESFSGRTEIILNIIKEHGPASLYQIAEFSEGRLKVTNTCPLNRTVTYFVNKLTSEGILQIVA